MKKKTVGYTVRFDEDLYELLKEEAERHRLSINSFILFACEEKLTRDSKEVVNEKTGEVSNVHDM